MAVIISAQVALDRVDYVDRPTYDAWTKSTRESFEQVYTKTEADERTKSLISQDADGIVSSVSRKVIDGLPVDRRNLALSSASPATSAECLAGTLSLSVPLEAGDEVTITLWEPWAAMTLDGGELHELSLCLGGGKVALGTIRDLPAEPSAGAARSVTVAVPDLSGYAPSDYDAKAIDVYDAAPGGGDDGAARSAGWTRAKVEYGDAASYWSAAPEDAEDYAARVGRLEESSTSLSQTASGLQASLMSMSDDLGRITSKVEVTTVEDDDGVHPLLRLATDGQTSALKTEITNDEIAIIDGASKAFWVTASRAHARDLDIEGSFTQGPWQWHVRSNGNLALKHVGGG